MSRVGGWVTYLEDFLTHHPSEEGGHGVEVALGAEGELLDDFPSFLLQGFDRDLGGWVGGWVGGWSEKEGGWVLKLRCGGKAS